MKFTRVSNNELRAILNNACEAFISHKNDFEETASTILWLETYDFSGIDMFLNHLDQHSEYNYIQPKIIDNEHASLIIDGKYECHIFNAHLISDIACTLFKKYENKGLAIINSKNPEALVPKLIESELFKNYLSINWMDENYLSYLFYRNENGSNLIIYKTVSELNEKYINTVVINNKNSHKNNENEIFKLNDLNKLKIINRIQPEHFRSIKQQKLMDGFYMENTKLNKLSSIANNVLVESSEKSRLGAGE